MHWTPDDSCGFWGLLKIDFHSSLLNPIINLPSGWRGSGDTGLMQCNPPRMGPFTAMGRWWFWYIILEFFSWFLKFYAEKGLHR